MNEVAQENFSDIKAMALELSKSRLSEFGRGEHSAGFWRKVVGSDFDWRSSDFSRLKFQYLTGDDLVTFDENQAKLREAAIHFLHEINPATTIPKIAKAFFEKFLVGEYDIYKAKSFSNILYSLPERDEFPFIKAMPAYQCKAYVERALTLSEGQSHIDDETTFRNFVDKMMDEDGIVNLINSGSIFSQWKMHFASDHDLNNIKRILAANKQPRPDLISMKPASPNKIKPVSGAAVDFMEVTSGTGSLAQSSLNGSPYPDKTRNPANQHGFISKKFD